MTPERKPVSASERSESMQLMLAMGSKKGFDPIPPDQYLTYQDPRYPPDVREWAWMLSKTIRHGYRSPYAVDERGKELRLEDMARDLGMDAGNARHYWRKLELDGRVRKDGRRLCVNGSFELPLEAKEKRSEVCTNLFPPYILKQIKRLAPERQAALFERYGEQQKLETKLLAEAVAGVRSIFDQRKDTILFEFGVKKTREKKRRPSESVLVPALLPIVEGYVQTLPEYEQTSNAGPYNGEAAGEAGSVQTPASLLTSELQRTTTERASERPLSARETAGTHARTRHGEEIG